MGYKRNSTELLDGTITLMKTKLGRRMLETEYALKL